MKAPHSFFERLLVTLRVRMVAVGLEVNDQALRLVCLRGGAWQFFGVRLEPGILDRGEIKDKEKFIAALASLKESAKVSGGRKKINVVLSLSAVDAYSQIFTLPDLAGDEFKKAVALNVQMASPGDAGSTYSGWEALGKKNASGNLEVLSAFIEKNIVDAMVRTLFEAGFFTIAVEPRSFAAVRAWREQAVGVDVKQSYLLVRVDDSGLGFLILRNGQPYFEYASRWNDMAEANGEVSIPRFQSEIVLHLRQVMNFYEKHWTEPIAGIIVAATSLQDEINAAITSVVTLPIMPLDLDIGQQFSPEWLIGLGLALRGLSQVSDSGEINLLGDEWKETFQKQHALEFLEFWQVLMPVALALLVAGFVAFSGYLASAQMSLASETALGSSGVTASENSEMQELVASSSAFNAEVGMIQQIEQSGGFSPILEVVTSAAASSSVMLSHVTITGLSDPTTVSGFASSTNAILAFKQALASSSAVTNLNLPLSGMQVNGSIDTFSLTFLVNPSP